MGVSLTNCEVSGLFVAYSCGCDECGVYVPREAALRLTTVGPAINYQIRLTFVASLPWGWEWNLQQRKLFCPECRKKADPAFFEVTPALARQYKE